MPATSLYQIDNHEDGFMLAAQGILQAYAAFSGVPVYLRDDVSELSDEGLQVLFTAGAANAEATRRIPATAPEPINNRAEFCQYTGELEIIISLPKALNTPITGVTGTARRFGQRIAQVRSLFKRSQLPFTTTNLPYYEVSQILPGGTEFGMNTDHHLEICRLTWTVTYAIRSTAYPVA